MSWCFRLNFSESAVHVWDVASGERWALHRPGFEAAQLYGLGSSL